MISSYATIDDHVTSRYMVPVLSVWMNVHTFQCVDGTPPQYIHSVIYIYDYSELADATEWYPYT